jgi:rhomboid protease GluP
MNREEPFWGIEAVEAVGVASPAIAPPSAERFEIAYGVGVYQRGDAWRAKSFKSRGAILFADGEVRILARAKRLFGADDETDLRLATRDIYNVVVTATLVRFDAAVQSGGFQTILIRANSRSEARAIASQLPVATTAEFAAESTRLDRFLDGMDSRTPHVWVTWTLVALNVLVYVAMVRSGGGFPKTSSQTALAFGSNFGPDTLNGEWWRLLAALFIHFSLVHVTFNMVVLVQMGRMAERLFGNARFAALYFFTGLTASLTSLCWHPVLNSAGASGAIFGVLGALLAYVVRYRSSMPRTFQAQRFRSAAFLVVYSLFNGLTHQGIDNAAHLGGLVSGFVMGWLLARPIDPVESRLDPRDAVMLSTSLAAFVIAAFFFQAVRSNSTPDARQELAFAVVEQQGAVAEQKAIKDSGAMLPMIRDPKQRDAVVAQIRSTVWPEWNALYERLNNALLPPGSRRAPLRAAQLRYYDDLRQAWLDLADEGAARDDANPGMSSKIKALLADAKVQRALVAKLAARG